MRQTPAAVMFATLLLLAAGLARAEEELGPGAAPADASDLRLVRPRLTVDLRVHAPTTAGLLLLVGAAQLWSEHLAPSTCHWCEPPQVDRWGRHQLLWKDTRTATTIGNLLIVVVPVSAAVALGLWAHADRAGFREGAEDLLVLTEAASVTLALMQVAKFTTVRLRPDAWAGSGSTTANSRMSFFAGHSAVAFAVAASTMEVARLRGRSGWRWFSAVAFVGAAASGFFRVASDNHWLTDVVSGAAIGTGVGLALPHLVLHPAGERATGVTLVPSPGGLALTF